MVDDTFVEAAVVVAEGFAFPNAVARVRVRVRVKVKVRVRVRVRVRDRVRCSTGEACITNQG